MSKTVESEVKVLAKHSVIYGLANVLDRIITFIMLPVYTRYLTPADYGVLELIYMTMSMIEMIVGLGIEAAVSRFYFDFKEKIDRYKVFSTAYLGMAIISVVSITALLPLSGTMAKFVLDSPENSPLFMLAIFNFGLGMFIPVAFSFFRVRQKSKTLMIFQICKTLLALSLNIYFVVFAEMKVFGILLATLITTSTFAILMTGFVLWNTGLRVDLGLLWRMIKFGLPLIPANISGYIVHASDRYFIKEYASMSLTGVYSIGYKFGSLINQFVTSPFIQIWTPRRFEYFNREDSERIYARIFTYFVTFSLTVGLQISILSEDVIKIATTEAFWPSYKIVPLVTLAYIIFSFHYHFNIGILMKKKTKYIAYINIVNGVLNLALNFILIRLYDIWGAAIATLISFTFKVSLTYLFSNRLYKIHIEWRRIITLFTLAIAVYFLSIQIETSSIFLNFPLKGLAGLSFLLALYIFRFFTEDEIRIITKIIKTRKLDF